MVPCHRVTQKDVSLTSYQSSSTTKRWLLEHENFE
ncbi:hypothetical protein CWE22_10715 [Pseudidiomarina aestuarii]|uniref:Methylated-DNA-[protein]-cysteine S-methyltransferase DNA binding domain-containing protein n=1 Tax=Pseudidiomarina aestuarii TaxID=624146 RepID=A0A7Z7ET28_9GAMM|nr:hypothetical protein CWE22_10715 [Pseudidiomarina aestuarii]